MVQPRLTDALSNRKSLESQYSEVHLKPIKQLWEDFESRERANKNEMERTSSGGDFQSVSPTVSFSNWLPSFYDELLLYLEQEWKWSMIAFPEDYKTLVPRLLSETMMAIGASFISHISTLLLGMLFQKQKHFD